MQLSLRLLNILFVLKTKQSDNLLVNKSLQSFKANRNWPRALGNRSLLFDPTNPDAKEIVNEIKEREEFRPFAGSMLLEYFDEYFITSTLKESPYMSYAIPVKKERVQQISSIVHHDYTCRIQTVTEEQNKNYYNLIKAWHEESNCNDCLQHFIQLRW